ncbi:2'-5' RNA ligase family protein [Streptomyces sulphureus]|uniref:2'-5' RNA ligase family protein n=1 Tax=Streptomyces sulphureus TaxID=47758 RepID=UPI001FE168AE|nr:2'-5' RNA ligase family protein [Streptomyces sulphureus]
MHIPLAYDPRAFPPAPPPHLDDAETIVEHDWKTFASLSSLDDHWARPGWHDGRRAYYWMLHITDPAVVDLARGCQRLLAHLGMDPVPEEGLHVTLCRVGDAAEVSKNKIDRLAEVTRQRLSVRQFGLRAHPLAGSRGAVRLTLTPWRDLVAVQQQLAGLGTELGLPGGRPVSCFRPHLSIAYNNVARPAEDVVEAVSELRAQAAADVRVSAVSLVELRREQPVYRWNSVVSLGLTG